MSWYQRQIAALYPDVDAAAIEAWMRLEYGVLDGLSTEGFKVAASAGAEMVREHPAESAELARSYGLR